jgi:diphthamide synthase (EF-2-diphthine--ammonia ligase)
MNGVFPLWKKDTKELLKEFISLKFKTIICCTNDAYLGEEWVGRVIDVNFPAALPSNVDACGENGEYHTFCFDGPVFQQPIKIRAGEKIYKPIEIKATDDCNMPRTQTKGFWFCDLLQD